MGMLQKDVKKRWTIKMIKESKWINDGYKVPLSQLGTEILSNVNIDEIESKGISIAAIMAAKRFAKKLANRRRKPEVEVN